MKRSHRIRAAFCKTALLLAGIVCVPETGAQNVDRALIERHFEQGNLSQARRVLETYWKKPGQLSRPDSLYVMKNLGVVYASSPRTHDQGDGLFRNLLRLDPLASIHDTYAGKSTLIRFRKVKRVLQETEGGLILAPVVAIFDFEGDAVDKEARRTLTEQFARELGSTRLFHVLDSETLREARRRLGYKEGDCSDRKCRLDFAERLSADKVVELELQAVDTVRVARLTYVDVESRHPPRTLKRVYGPRLDLLVSEGLRELVEELIDTEAAWLKVAPEPPGAALTANGVPMPPGGRLPLMPGRHVICAESPGYETLCREFIAKKPDPLTYSMKLPLKGGDLPEPVAAGQPDGPPSGGTGGNEKALPKESADGETVVWIIVGSMALVAVILALAWNTAD